MRSGIVTLVVAVALLISACSTDPRLEVLEANPLASATLTFAEPSERRTYDPGEFSNLLDPPVNGIGIEVTFSPLPPELVDQGRDELINQAEDAGFNMQERISQRIDQDGIRQELWLDENSAGIAAVIKLTEDSLTVDLSVVDRETPP